MGSSVILVSGGLDSCVNLKAAVDDGSAVLALTFDYGQKAAQREMDAAGVMCERLRVRHEVVSLPWLGELGGSALTEDGVGLPKPDEAELDDEAAAARSAEAVWIPNRNGIFVNVGAAYAEALGADGVVAGFNAEEAATFPDNSVEFMSAATEALRFSTSTGVRLESYTAEMTKREVVVLAQEIEAPLELAWPCYDGGERPCGVCESCVRFRRAVREAGAEEWLEARSQGDA